MKQRIKTVLLKAKTFVHKFVRYGGGSLFFFAYCFFGCWVIFDVYETLGFSYDEFYIVFDRYLSLVAFENVEWFVIAILCFLFLSVFLIFNELVQGFFNALSDIFRCIKSLFRSRKDRR